MQHPFHFSISKALKEVWGIYTKHLTFFLVLGAIMMVLNFGADNKHLPVVLSVLIGIVSFVVSIVWLKVSLHAVRSQDDKLVLGRMVDLVPSFTQCLSLIGVYLLSGLFVFAGFVVFIIPGLYVAFRLTFAGLRYLDRQEGVRASVRFSWDITKGVFWTVLLVGLTALVLYILGAITFGIGLLITYPLATLLTAKLYTALVERYEHTQAVDVQPVEIPPTPPTPSPETEPMQ